MCSKLFTGLLALILSAAISTAQPAQAQTFSFTSGTYSADHLANDGTVGTANDSMSLSSVSDSVILTTGTPVLANINGVTFGAGPSSTGHSGAYGPISYSGSESFTFNGVTQTLTFPYAATINTVGSVPDLLQFLGGNTTIFSEGALGQVAITPLALKLTSLGGTTAGTLQASFLLTPPAVPEASTIASFGLLLALGLGGLVVAGRQTRRSLP